MGAIASQNTSLTIVYSTVYSGTDQRKHGSSASLAFVRGIHRWPVNSTHKGPVSRKMFPFDASSWHYETEPSSAAHRRVPVSNLNCKDGLLLQSFFCYQWFRILYPWGEIIQMADEIRWYIATLRDICIGWREFRRDWPTHCQAWTYRQWWTDIESKLSRCYPWCIVSCSV